MSKEENEAKKPTSDDFTVGAKDPQGRTIACVYFSFPEYVIYRTDKGIKVFTYDDHLAREDRIYTSRFLDIGAELATIYSLQPEEIARVESINIQIARGINQCFEGRLEAAKAILNDACARLIRLRRLQGRLEYLFSAFALLGLFLILSGILHMFASVNVTIIYSNIISCGAIGGFLSVALGVWKLDIDLDANRSHNLVSGASRIFISALAAVVVYFAVKSNVVFGVLYSETSNTGIYLCSVIAGFSETFVPNVIRRLSEQEEHRLDKAQQGTQAGDSASDGPAA